MVAFHVIHPHLSMRIHTRLKYIEGGAAYSMQIIYFNEHLFLDCQEGHETLASKAIQYSFLSPDFTQVRRSLRGRKMFYTMNIVTPAEGKKDRVSIPSNQTHILPKTIYSSLIT